MKINFDVDIDMADRDKFLNLVDLFLPDQKEKIHLKNITQVYIFSHSF